MALTIPFSLLFAFVLMHLTHIPANLLSLGAIDFGIIVDSAIVIMEVILRRREQMPGQRRSRKPPRAKRCWKSPSPMFFATLIVITAYLPLFAFERVEKKLFTPMAFTVCYALLGGLFFALVAIPPLAFSAYRKPGKAWHNPALRVVAREI